MSCNNFIPDNFGCASSKGHTLEIASEAIKLDLSKPIDISSLSVFLVEFVPIEDRYGRKWLATAELGGWVTNDEGKEDKIEIIIKRTSNRRPKLPGE